MSLSLYLKTNVSNGVAKVYKGKKLWKKKSNILLKNNFTFGKASSFYFSILFQKSLVNSYVFYLTRSENFFVKGIISSITYSYQDYIYKKFLKRNFYKYNYIKKILFFNSLFNEYLSLDKYFFIPQVTCNLYSITNNNVFSVRSQTHNTYYFNFYNYYFINKKVFKYRSKILKVFI